MQHVDDGTLHAWLDRQVTDPEDVARIDTHLRECPSCRARLADERATLEQADALLAAAAPADEAGRPAFETLVVRAGSGGSGPADSRSGLRTWVMPVGWAASVALAAALGWAVRDRAPLGVEPRSGERTASQPATRQTASSPAAQVQTQSGAQAAVSPTPSQPTSKGVAAPSSTDTPESSQRQVAAGEAAAFQSARPPEARTQSPRAEPARENQGQVFSLNGALGESETGGAAVNIAPAPAPAAAQASPAPQPAPPPPPQEVAFTLNAQANADAAARAPEARAAAPPPPAGGAPAGGGGGGGGRGARGGGGGGRGGGGRGGGAAPAGDGANQGRILADGVAGGAAGAADASGWRPLPRTDAAAQSGMALFGIEGLMPMATMLSADNSAVRTIYRLESGETIELVQQKVAVADRARAGAAGAASTATAAQGQLGQAQLGQGQGQGARPADPPPWTTVRDDVRLTLRGTANLSALGERLRLD